MTKISADGQVTVPRFVLEHLGLKPGDEVTFEVAKDGRVVIANAKATPSHFAELRGTAGAGMTTDEIMDLTRGE